MKALSFWEPWGTLVAQGHKTVETRSWSTDYRGPILIHAAKRWEFDQQEVLDSYWPIADMFPSDWKPSLGHALAVATLTDCFEMTVPMVRRLKQEADKWDRGTEMSRHAAEFFFGDWKAGRFGWLFKDVRPLEPFPLRGHQRLWDAPAEVAERLSEVMT